MDRKTKTYKITTEMLRDPLRSIKYPGVDTPGNYWYSESKNRFYPIITEELADIESGLGIGGTGSDDHNIHTESDAWPEYQHGRAPAGSQVCPAGTTFGQSDPDGRCARCGAPADWNPGAGEHLCARHWDNY